jgi:Tfp pilus assembly protein PilP
MTTTVARAGVLAALAAVAIVAPLTAQAPQKGAAQTAKTPEQPAAKSDLPIPPPNFEYSSAGRRDPFVSLAARGDDGKTARRGDGVPGLLTGELSVRGIVRTRGEWVAMVAGPDGKVFTVRAGARLADGVIRTVTESSVVIFQEVNDPLSLEKQREVRKFLRGGGEAK